MGKFTQYLKDSKAELKKVAWPTKKEVIKHSMIVIGVSLFVAVFLGLVDFLLNLAIGTII
ncbi:preprotein translocase subunit SecE [Patescibacteria group bacterium]|nr:preprotein translocase subunit SecE [Patescibacteria group bacterium]